MNIKSLILSSASLAALLVASSASAADLPKHHSKMPVAIMVKSQPAVFAWDGPYAGAEVGGNFSYFSNKAGGTKQSTSDVEKNFGKPKNKLIGGVFAGYNANVGNNVILGIDGNLDFGKSDKTIIKTVTATTPVDGFAYKEKLSGAARVRVGYAMDRFMPYVAGGLTVTDIEAAQGDKTAGKAAIADTGKLSNVSKLKSSAAMGWNVGAGVDYAISDNLILRADYRHSQITDPKVNKAVDNKADAQSSHLEKLKGFSVNSNDVRVGIAYKF
ncbi:outer membrane beta-barrel protein [Bartonella sp. TP]|uniref:outer membrane protein n=1 Tax=Bartonella sp. TP TaxID=3057550 RepID=UPI0025AFAF8E|nr:outer membrane beta-barrel protein [Bartonella sp. TP]WJW80358.1 outer membrane beta-barrel protein [Bartonella sp. TP]